MKFLLDYSMKIVIWWGKGGGGGGLIFGGWCFQVGAMRKFLASG